MREFEDGSGRRWIASIQGSDTTDYKGRFHFIAHPVEGAADELVELLDVRWNSEASARRTLETMSDVELRRRLRSAVGRSVAFDTD